MSSGGSFPAFIEKQVILMDNRAPNSYALLVSGQRPAEQHHQHHRTVTSTALRPSLSDRLRSMLRFKRAVEKLPV